MNKRINAILRFHCPSWDELPSEALLSSDLLHYINNLLDALIIKDELLTKTMIQNYVKWKVLPAPDCKKYGRAHIALLIVISVYKQIINIQSLSSGIGLQLNIMEFENAYNKFASTLNNALHRTFSYVHGDTPFVLEEVECESSMIGLTAVANAFALKLLSNILIDNKGYKNTIQKVEE